MVQITERTSASSLLSRPRVSDLRRKAQSDTSWSGVNKHAPNTPTPNDSSNRARGGGKYVLLVLGLVPIRAFSVQGDGLVEMIVNA